MTRSKQLLWMGAGALVMIAVLVAGAFRYAPVFAQDVTPTPGTETQEATPAPGTTSPDNDEQAAPRLGQKAGRGLGEGAGEARGGYTQEDLAAALGIDVNALETARQAALEAGLNQAVAQGLITQEQADAYLANDRFPMAGKGWLAGSGIDYNALLADALGISTDELAAAKLEAYNTAVDRAVTAGTLTAEQADLLKGRAALYADPAFQSSMTSAFEAAVQQAVTDGVITQAQADAILAQAQSRGFNGLFGPGWGHGGGRHGGRGGNLSPDDGARTQSVAPTEGTSGEL